MLLSEINENSHLPKKRRRYSKIFYDFAFSISAISSKVYRLIRSVFPFPSLSNVRNEFNPVITKYEYYLQDETNISEIMQNYQILIGYQ
jgi:hypothetical protein